MGTKTRLLLCILATQCALVAVGMGQSRESAGEGTAAVFDRPSQLKRPECGNLTPIDGCLAQYGVPLTKEGLLAALRSTDPEIRALDEEVLAYRGIKDAIPELFMLLITTYDPDERIRLADALAELGEEQGVETLRRYCDDATASMYERLAAARCLLRYQPRSCPEALIAALRDDTYRLVALPMIPEFKELSQEQSAEARSVLLKSVADQDFIVRLQAAETIAATRDVTYIPALQAALVRESQEAVRDAIQYCLKQLQGVR